MIPRGCVSWAGTDTTSVVPILTLGNMFERQTLAKGRKMSDVSREAPDADVAEQDQEAIPGGDELREEEDLDVPLEADVADLNEQARGLGPDDEEYR
jgi:hypothetical protein